MVLMDAVNTSFRDRYLAMRGVESILDRMQLEERVAIHFFHARFPRAHDS